MSNVVAQLSEHNNVLKKKIIEKSINSDNSLLCSSSIRVTSKECVPKNSSATITELEEKMKETKNQR